MDNRIGNGTAITTCENCGKPVLTGNLIKHLHSRECREKGEKIKMQKEINDLEKKVERLEKKEKERNKND